MVHIHSGILIIPDESERREWKSWLKSQHSKNKDHGIQCHHFMANRWGNNGNSIEFILGGSKITVDGDCSHEFNKTLAPWKKSYGIPKQHIKKQRHYFPTKVRLVKAMVFPAVMYGCESWTIKKAECQRIDAFELWCWRRLLSIPWTEWSPTGQS